MGQGGSFVVFADVSAVPEFVTWLRLVERELMLFALVWFLIGIVDEGAIDLIWAAMRLGGRMETPRLAADAGAEARPLGAPIAVFIPAWREAGVIGATIAHMLHVWRDPGLTLYVGCYANDPETIEAAMRACADARLRIVIHAHLGPTTKADCLNRLFAALRDDEARRGVPFRAVVLHDAEDMVHPLALAVIDRGLDEADLVQLPVRPELPAGMHWVAGHYADEFTESHAKALRVRDALGAAVPAAGVGVGISRPMLDRIAALRAPGVQDAGGMRAPFAFESLTEDYEIGLLIHRAGGKTMFVRVRDAEGALVATRSYFPGTLITAVRQKSRWIHGISLQAWDRMGWDPQPVEVWMAMRDRKGPLAALVLLAGYAVMMLELVLAAGRETGVVPMAPVDPTLERLMQVCALGLFWRAGMRGIFVGREYGWGEGLLAVARIPVANAITIMAARRALVAYWRTLRGGRVAWDKTTHDLHPARLAPA